MTSTAEATVSASPAIVPVSRRPATILLAYGGAAILTLLPLLLDCFAFGSQ
jgi:hypothetical protein